MRWKLEYGNRSNGRVSLGKRANSVVMEFPDRAALDEYLKHEPYAAEGVWRKIEVEAMNVVLVNGEKA